MVHQCVLDQCHDNVFHMPLLSRLSRTSPGSGMQKRACSMLYLFVKETVYVHQMLCTVIYRLPFRQTARMDEELSFFFACPPRWTLTCDF